MIVLRQGLPWNTGASCQRGGFNWGHVVRKCRERERERERERGEREREREREKRERDREREREREEIKSRELKRELPMLQAPGLEGTTRY